MRNSDWAAVCEGLRTARNPIDWFEDPSSVCNLPMDWYEWNQTTLYALPPFVGRRSSPQINTNKQKGLMTFLDTTAGANKVWEAVMGWDIMPIPQTSPALERNSFGIPWFWSMRMNRSNPIGVDAGEKYQGISWGDASLTDTPWQSTYIGAGLAGKVGLHWNYTLSKWQVFVYSLLEVDIAPALHICTTQPPFSVDLDTAEVALMYVPPDADHRRSRLVAIINGIVALDLFDNDRCNHLTDSDCKSGPGIYFTNGSDAASRAAEAGFYNGRFWMGLGR